MKIKEVEKHLLMNAQTIRYYEKLGFLNPERDANGYRHYSNEDVQILKRIRFLRELDISLEMIGIILKQPEEFQKIIERHTRNLKAQVEHLELIEKKCESIRQKNIPLLDAIIDGKFEDIPEMSTSRIKNIVQRTKDYMKPSAVVTLGRKMTSFQLIKTLCIYFIAGLLVLSAWKVFLQRYYYIDFNLMTVFLLSFIFAFFVLLISFHEKYYEFGDTDLYIYDSKNQSTLKSITALLKNETDLYAKRYLYDDIASVTIDTKKFYSGVGFGISQCFKKIYHIKMKNGEVYTINTSLYHDSDQQRTLVRDILDHYQISVIEKTE